MRILVFLVSFATIFTYGSVWYVLILQDTSYWLGSITGVFQVFIQAAVFALTISSYINVVRTPPGSVPSHWKPEGFTDEELEKIRKSSSSQESSRKRNLKVSIPRYCGVCQIYKPQRTHHCSECDVCVLKMDHHCPWINNCVGFKNHKLFVVFLFWCGVGLFYALCTFVVKLIFIFMKIAEDNGESLSPFHILILVANFFLLFPFVFGVTVLFKYQMKLVSRNLTTVEYHIQKFAKCEAKKAGATYVWPYDFGTKQNFEQFFGTKKVFWLLPILPKNIGDGLYFPINPISESNYCGNSVENTDADHTQEELPEITDGNVVGTPLEQIV